MLKAYASLVLVYVKLHAKLHVQGVRLNAMAHVKTRVKSIVEKVHAHLCVILVRGVHHLIHAVGFPELVKVLVSLAMVIVKMNARVVVQVDAKVSVAVYAAHARESVTVAAPILVLPFVVEAVALTAI